MQDTESEEDGFGSLPLNLSSVPFTGRFEPGCRQKKGCQVIILLLQTSTYCTTESGKRNVKLLQLKVSTNRQIILIRVEEVVQVIYGHHQIRLMDEAGGGHSVMSSPPLSICTAISSVNFKRFEVRFLSIPP